MQKKMDLIEEMVLQQFRELPKLPDGYYYDYSFEHRYNANTQVWEYVVTAIPVQKERIVVRDIHGKETILD